MWNFHQKSITSFLAPKKNEKQEAEEQMARIMIRRNESFLFFDDPDVKALYAKAYPNLQVIMINE